MGLIYILKHKINNKYYVGQTTNAVDDRIKGHKCDAKRSNSYFGNALNKYGVDSFNIYKYIVPNELLDMYERHLINKLNTLKPNGYNLESGGHKNKKHSEETKLKIGKNRKGKYAGKNHPLYGKHHSKETKLLISIANIGNKSGVGHKCSEDGKRRISIANKGNTYALGAVRSAENKRNESIARTGKGNPMYNKKHSIETKRKMQLSSNTNKEVIQYDLNNQYISEYYSITKASKMTNINRMCISNTCAGKKKIAGGFIWKYKENA